MAKHKFEIPIGDKAGNIVGARCIRCGKIEKFESAGKLSDAILAEDCTPEDASQAAARIVRESTENK